MIAGYGVCGPNEKYLDITLQSFRDLGCDVVVICGNNIDENSRHKIQSHGFEVIDDNREWGLYQPKIKESLVRYVAEKYKPDWFVAMDMDERFDKFLTAEKLRNIIKRGHQAYSTTVINLWDTGYNPRWTFDKVQIWRNDGNYEFESKNLHCGLVPKVYALNFAYSEHLLIHHGLKDKEDRLRKAKRYEKYDPNAQFKGEEYYQALVSDKKPVDFDEELLYNKFKKEVETFYQPIRKTMSIKEKKYWYVRRKSDGEIMDIPDYQLADTLARGEHELITKDPVIVDGDSVKTSRLEQSSAEDNVCKDCGFVAKNAFGLRAHNKEHAPEERKVENKCAECDFVAKTATGLKIHQKKHDGNNNS